MSKAGFVVPAVEDPAWGEAVARAEQTLGKIAARVFCSRCSRVAGWVHDSHEGLLYHSDVPFRPHHLGEATYDHVSNNVQSTTMYYPWPHYRWRILLERSDAARSAPDFDPEHVGACCSRRHLEVTVALSDLERVAHDYRSRGKPQKLQA